VSEQRFLVLGEQPVVDGEKVHAMQQPVNDDRVAPDLGIELSEAAQAQKLLRETDDFIYAVSEKVGFHEFRHFSRTFKAMTGFHPTEYRAQFRSGGLSTPPCTSSEGRIVHRAV